MKKLETKTNIQNSAPRRKCNAKWLISYFHLLHLFRIHNFWPHFIIIHFKRTIRCFRKGRRIPLQKCVCSTNRWKIIPVDLFVGSKRLYATQNMLSCFLLLALVWVMQRKYISIAVWKHQHQLKYIKHSMLEITIGTHTFVRHNAEHRCISCCLRLTFVGNQNYIIRPAYEFFSLQRRRDKNCV